VLRARLGWHARACESLGHAFSASTLTGANSGIGTEIARQLVAAGLTVYVGSRDGDRGQRAVLDIGGDAPLLAIDVTDEASIADDANR
jgi:NADP-dependent 3-hydroxy acid dehydrogenase YdfG